MKIYGRFLNDCTEGWDPLRFAVVFTRRMRKHKGISHTPSLRTSLAIPKFLTARYFRTRILSPKDYIQSAVLNTVPEDQVIAEQIAHEILFPKAEEKKKTQDHEKKTPEPEADPMSGIMADIASLDIDFDSLDDLSSFEQILEAETHEMGAFDLFERMYSSADDAERSLAELTANFGGPAELESYGIRTVPRVSDYLCEMLRSQIGALTPDTVRHGCRAGFGDMLAREVSTPWELAGALAGNGDTENLELHLDDLLDNVSAHELGKTMQFLAPHQAQPSMDRITDDFARHAMDKARDLSEFGEILTGLDRWIDPPDELLGFSASDNIRRALNTASELEKQFGVDLEDQLFGLWADALPDAPSLEQLADVAVDCPQWRDMVNTAYDHHVRWLRQQVSKPAEISETLAPVDRDVYHAVTIADRLAATKIRSGVTLAGRLATETLCLLCHKDHFLPMLDEFLDRNIMPSHPRKVIEAGDALGVDPDEIIDRIGDFVAQLKQMILSNLSHPVRYKMLAQRIRELDDELAEELTAKAYENRNMESMAALLAVNMGIATTFAPDDFVMKSIGFRGIGGGSNLLKQWFTHRDTLNDSLKTGIKAIAREALIELAFDWINKGTGGSGEAGLIPQNQARPFMAGDDLDYLDIESTLDAIVSSGKRLDAITEEELFVYDTSKGRAALGVLIDISGSMDGQALAICAIAVVMLLGKVRSEEIALAVFESDTHVIKSFEDNTDLDEVADHLLNLRATGGTRADAALKWIGNEFEGVPEADFRLLFILSDFCFFESHEEIQKLAGNLAEQGAVFLCASHGYLCKETLNVITRVTDGHTTQLKSVDRLPAILIETLRQIGEEQL